MLYNETMNKSKKPMLLWLVVLVIIAAAASAYFYTRSSQNSGPNQNWQTYTDASFNFSISYPSGWEVATTTQYGTPIYNVYVPVSNDATNTPPFIHHNNITNVSLFPNGVPTEGLFSQSKPLDFYPGFDVATATSRVFITEAGTPFAAYLRPLHMPRSWGESGFIWIRVRMDDAIMKCFDQTGQQINFDRCDPLTEHHTVTWTGTVDPSAWNTAEEILKTIKLGP